MPEGKGRAKHYARQERFHNMDVCALITAVAWDEARGEWPGVTNEVARSACDALWGAAGGDIERRGKESLDIWRPHLQKAKTYRDSEQARLIRHALTKRREKEKSPIVPGKSIKARIARRFEGK